MGSKPSKRLFNTIYNMIINLVTGSSGFIGTNLVKKLLQNGECVIGIDNFSASEKWKSEFFSSDYNYEFFEFDITKDLKKVLDRSKILKKYKKIDCIYNLACPASPPRYLKLSLETIKVNTEGMFNVLEIAKQYNATILHTSTSEIYGDPLVHPQTESYRGNVNTVGPRSCYDEGKRISETICYEFKRLYDINIKVVRIFNTYGPYMDPNDGRVITNFILQALKSEDLTIYGEGLQTRSFQYIDDLIDAFLKLVETDKSFMGPINLGNPSEFTIKQLASLVLKLIPESKSKIESIKMNEDDPYNKKHDPQQRRPDISLAKNTLNWEPKVSLEEGLIKTIEYYKHGQFD